MQNENKTFNPEANEEYPESFEERTEQEGDSGTPKDFLPPTCNGVEEEPELLKFFLGQRIEIGGWLFRVKKIKRREITLKVIGTLAELLATSPDQDQPENHIERMDFPPSEQLEHTSRRSED